MALKFALVLVFIICANLLRLRSVSGIYACVPYITIWTRDFESVHQLFQPRTWLVSYYIRKLFYQKSYQNIVCYNMRDMCALRNTNIAWDAVLAIKFQFSDILMECLLNTKMPLEHFATALPPFRFEAGILTCKCVWCGFTGKLKLY